MVHQQVLSDTYATDYLTLTLSGVNARRFLVQRVNLNTARMLSNLLPNNRSRNELSSLSKCAQRSYSPQALTPCGVGSSVPQSTLKNLADYLIVLVLPVFKLTSNFVSVWFSLPNSSAHHLAFNVRLFFIPLAYGRTLKPRYGAFLRLFNYSKVLI